MWDPLVRSQQRVKEGKGAQHSNRASKCSLSGTTRNCVDWFRAGYFGNLLQSSPGQTYLQRKHGSNSEGLAADRVLLPSLYGENLYT
ncbi:hypothetical protein TNCT_125801 [Trichonephila clavata]|uniref:Uncharacterized protein n=1 Tax=Trichonephila clavata TaxID=2740835 RepID=A0A8X6LF59_TRICU|nr:hypothetical protein TNCT_125801 [Trichonephila clavata]